MTSDLYILTEDGTAIQHYNQLEVALADLQEWRDADTNSHYEVEGADYNGTQYNDTEREEQDD